MNSLFSRDQGSSNAENGSPLAGGSGNTAMMNNGQPKQDDLDYIASLVASYTCISQREAKNRVQETLCSSSVMSCMKWQPQHAMQLRKHAKLPQKFCCVFHIASDRSVHRQHCRHYRWTSATCKTDQQTCNQLGDHHHAIYTLIAILT